MKKIPTVLVRDPKDRAHVLDEITPGCEWVLAGEGVATRKYDGTCVKYDGERWWARREVKPGKQPPSGFRAEQHDEVTGKTVGWEPIEQSSFAKFHAEALELVSITPDWPVGTYELIGPKVQGNPEKLPQHVLVPHATADQLGEFKADSQRDIKTVKASVRVAGTQGYEGIVWHHPDGRMAKLKVRDLPAAGEEELT